MQRSLLTFFGSRTMLRLIIGVFVFEAIWIALTGRYPGAFDENFHFGLIRLYAGHWVPFLDAQPPNAEVYGAVARDPSYLYHYLMSFPYRLVAVFTHSETLQIIILRLLNVVMAAVGLVLYARVLRRTALSPQTQNAIMVLFTMIPVFPLLAGQINYDNLLFVLTAVIMGWTIDFVGLLRDGVWGGRLLGKIIVVSIVASMIKYAFLPVLAGIFIFLWLFLWTHRAAIQISAVPRRIGHALHKWPNIVLAASFLLVSGLFFQRYGINVLRYHTPVPDCSQVITVDECSSYAPWQRDNILKQSNTEWKREHVGVYADMWLHQMVRETYFTVYGAFFPGTTVVDYKVAEPLPFMIILAWTLTITGAIAVLLCLPVLLREPIPRLFLLVGALYIAALFVQNYKAYVETAVPVAIHGRYLLPVLPFLFVLIFLAYRHIFFWVRERFPRITQASPIMAVGGWVLLLVLCTQGGGIITHIIRSNSDWYWQQSATAQRINDTSRSLLKPVVVEQTLR